MSINPVPEIRLAPDSAAAIPTVHTSAASPDPIPARNPDSGTRPVRESAPTNQALEPSEMPQDEVQVQRTGSGSNDIVIRYMDAHGNLILQIPSSQVLGLARAVEQALDEQASRRPGPDAESTSGQGETSNGN